MKHKHYDMIVAKAANMELETFIKEGGKWRLMSNAIPIAESFEYFLCLPHHKEACLHWLNGGKVESLHKDYEPMELAESGAIEWGVKSTFMKDSIEIRIKPKKEKRWIGVHLDSNQTTPAISEEKMCSDYVLMSCVLDGSPFCEWQFIEIEVEI